MRSGGVGHFGSLLWYRGVGVARTLRVRCFCAGLKLFVKGRGQDNQGEVFVLANSALGP